MFSKSVCCWVIEMRLHVVKVWEFLRFQLICLSQCNGGEISCFCLGCMFVCHKLCLLHNFYTAWRILKWLIQQMFNRFRWCAEHMCHFLSNLATVFIVGCLSICSQFPTIWLLLNEWTKFQKWFQRNVPYVVQFQICLKDWIIWRTLVAAASERG